MELSYQHGGVYCRNIDESIKFYEEIFGFRLLFRADAMEGDKPLKMAWIKGAGTVLELLESENKSSCDAAAQDLNHFAFRVNDMDEFVSLLNDKGVAIEAGPFDPPLEFDRPLEDRDSDVFVTYGKGGAQLRIMFFRGPSGERFEVVQDNIGAL